MSRSASDTERILTRRQWIPAAASLASAACAKKQTSAVESPAGAQRPPSPVAILKAKDYTVDFASLIARGIAMCGVSVKGRSVLLKPNLVEFDSNTCINTNMAVLAAAWEVFRKLGAARVTIGEGPGHRRDTLHIAEQARYFEAVPQLEKHFVDLNRDDVAPIPGFLDDHPLLYISKTVLAADLIVSLPKMKTHHWAGATLAMKNFFGLVPGNVYGWPKNPLHYAGIDRSIYELNRIFRKTFAIVDGVVGMEGNGPIQGTPRPCGVLVMGQDLVAVDATCCRIMGIDPAQIRYLTMAKELGNAEEARIEQRAEKPESVRTPFHLIDQFAHLRLG